MASAARRRRPHIDEWLKKKCANSPKTFNNHLTYIKTFFNWCIKRPRVWITENPIEGMDKKRIAYKEPEYMAPGDVERVFRELEKMKSTRHYGEVFLAVLLRREAAVVADQTGHVQHFANSVVSALHSGKYPSLQ